MTAMEILRKQEAAEAEKRADAKEKRSDAKMAAMGVPHGSVQAKMKLDNIDAAQMSRLMRALGQEGDEGGERGGGGKGCGPPGRSPGRPFPNVSNIVDI